MTSICDGKIDCEDSSDEFPGKCRKWSCPAGTKKCRDRSNKCISAPYVLDGKEDCPGGSDEDPRRHPKCAAGYQKCRNLQRCIEEIYWCDGRTCDDGEDCPESCPDASDEGVACKMWDCLDDYWKCANDLQCIPARHVCERNNTHVYDCHDKSDEHNQLCGCPDPGDWACHDGDGCIIDTQVCDGIPQCNDESDELTSVCVNWTCSTGLWKCGDLKCISRLLVCDGKAHCDDASDELLCLDWECADGWTKCANGLQCIKNEAFCNGKTDCSDFSDEADRFCTDYNCLSGFTKCADNKQCINVTKICDGNWEVESGNCRDISDELCDSHCLKSPLKPDEKYIIRKCQEDENVCFPVHQYCDGVTDCPQGSDEAESGCTCEDWGLITCSHENNSLCLYPEWSATPALSDTIQPCITLITQIQNNSSDMRANDTGLNL